MRTSLRIGRGVLVSIFLLYPIGRGGGDIKILGGVSGVGTVPLLERCFGMFHVTLSMGMSHSSFSTAIQETCLMGKDENYHQHITYKDSGTLTITYSVSIASTASSFRR